MDVPSRVGVEGDLQEVSLRVYPHVRAVERHPQKTTPIAHERASTEIPLPTGGIDGQPIRKQNNAYS